MSDLRRRFYSKVEMGPGGCWMWTGDKRLGYGFIWNNGSCNNRAHRVSWELHVGPIPDGMHVCHACDVPACVNPAHLFIGTQADNLSDMRKKGRGAKGERHGRAKLKSHEVREIKSLIESGMLGKDVARLFGVSNATVSHIIHGKNWAAP